MTMANAPNSAPLPNAPLRAIAQATGTSTNSGKWPDWQLRIMAANTIVGVQSSAMAMPHALSLSCSCDCWDIAYLPLDLFVRHPVHGSSVAIFRLRQFGKRCLSQQQHARNGNRILQRESYNFGRIDDTHLHEVDIPALTGVEAIVTLARAHPV